MHRFVIIYTLESWNIGTLEHWNIGTWMQHRTERKRSGKLR